MRYFMEAFDWIEFNWFILFDEQREDVGFILLPTELCEEKAKTSCGSFAVALKNNTGNIGVGNKIVLFARLDPTKNVYIHCEDRVLAVINKIMTSNRESICVFRVGEDGFGMVIDECLKIYLPEPCYLYQHTANA